MKLGFTAAPAELKVDCGHTDGLIGNFYIRTGKEGDGSPLSSALGNLSRRLASPGAFAMEGPILTPEQWIEDRYYSGPFYTPAGSTDFLWPRKKLDFIKLANGDITEVILCLHPDTVIPLLDGSTSTLKALADKWAAGDHTPFWVYGVKPDGQVVPALAEAPRQTGEDDYYRVTLDDGSWFESNARHQMVLRTGEKRQVQDMKPGDSLMPFKTEKSSKKKGRRIEGYELVLNPASERLEYTHALVDQCTNGPIDSRVETIHHQDFRKLNNEPGNLRRMHWTAHHALHVAHRKEMLANNPEMRAALVVRAKRNATDPDSKLRQGHHAFMQSPAGKDLALRNLTRAAEVISATPREVFVQRGKTMCDARWNGEGGAQQRTAAAERMRARNLAGNASAAGKRAWTGRSEESREKTRTALVERNKLGKARRTDISLEAILTAKAQGAETMFAATQVLGCSKTRIIRVIKDAGLTPKEVFSRCQNHYVVSIEKVGHGPVYCMTVPETENFAICTQFDDGRVERQGVFSSNTGSIGSGKSSILVILAMYDLYRISRFVCPQQVLGLNPTSTLAFVLISLNVTKARAKLYDPLRMAVDSTPYFLREFRRDPKRESTLFFPDKNILVKPGVTGEAAIHSEDVVWAGISECLVGDSMVDMADGTRAPIASLMGRTVHVMSRELDGSFAPRMAVGKKIGYRPVLRIELGDGTYLRCTHSHEILTSRGYVAARDLEVGDHVVQRKAQSGDPAENAGCVGAPQAGGSRQDLRGDKGQAAPGEVGRVGRPGEAGCCGRALQTALGRPGDASQDRSWDSKPSSLARAHGEVPGGGEGGLGRPGAKSADVGGSGGQEEVTDNRASRQDLGEQPTASGTREVVPGGSCASVRKTNGTPALPGDAGADEPCQTRAHAHRGVQVQGDCPHQVGYDPLPEHLGVGDAVVDGVRSGHHPRGLRGGTDSVSVQGHQQVVRAGLPGDDYERDVPDRGEAFLLRAKERQDQGETDRRLDSQHPEQLEVPTGIRVGAGGRVDSIRPDGHEFVYDLSVPHTRNYVANGVVVHNCNFYSVVANSKKKRGGETLDVAADLVINLERRMNSRFLQQGKLPFCRIVLDSSRQYPDDFVERRIQDIGAGRIGHPCYVASWSSWEVREGVRDAAGNLLYSGETFPVEVGDSSRHSRILTRDEVKDARGRIVEVPVERREEFERDLEGALRDVAGIAVLSLHPLISNRAAVLECCRTLEGGFAPGETAHPFNAASLSLQDNFSLYEDYLVDPETKRPRINPDRLRTVHVDFALTGDCLGFCMGHVEDVVTILRGGINADPTLPCLACRGEGRTTCSRCNGGGNVYHFKERVKCAVCRGAGKIECASCRGTGKYGVPVNRPRVYVDLMLQVIPPANGQIQFDDIEALMRRLRGMGFQIPIVTADGYESAQFLQRQLKEGAGIAEKLSVDVSKDPYFSGRNAIYDVAEDGRRRVSYYEYPPFLAEITRVEDRPQKIDHPHNGSKDVADAFVGVVYNCERFDVLHAPAGGAVMNIQGW